MCDSNSDQDRSVESTDEGRVPPEVLAESIRNKTSAIDAHGDALAEALEAMDDDEDVSANTAAMMTELLETASDLIAVAHDVESARLQESAGESEEDRDGAQAGDGQEEEE